MKIVDSFLFNNEYEANVLLCKLHAEYEFVDEFIGMESTYDFRGNKKEVYLNKVINNDNRFKPFLDKITVITNTKNLLPEGEKNEKQYFVSEFNSRALCWEYVQKKYDDNDWLILSDCDEMLDFSHVKKRDILLEDFRKYNESIQLINLKFWWDFDNLNLNPDKYIPCHKVGALKERENPFHHRNNHCKRLEPSLAVGIEYAYCFSAKGNWNKVNTFAHDKYREETLEKAYLFNTWHKESNRNEYINSPLDFFETIQLDETNATKFVLENLHKLKVNTIDNGYAENRVRYLGVVSHPCRHHNLMRGFKINKSYDYERK